MEREAEPKRAQALIDWIHSAKTLGEKAELKNMTALMDALGHPERAFRSIHVAGTNGKGSTCAFLDGALRAQGIKTGLYTSPYLMRYQERIQLDGEPIDDASLIASGERVRAAAEALHAKNIKPTVFELGTALAFCAFASAGIEAAVIETGIGGRLDPTNVLMPEVAVITAIGYDHMALLGDTLEKIAGEKAGILKSGASAAFYPQLSEAGAVLDARAKALGVDALHASLLPLKNVRQDAHGASFDIDAAELGPISIEIGIPGLHQIENARLAIAALLQWQRRGLPMSATAIEHGLRDTRWPARLEWMGENVLLDGAHNPHGAEALTAYLGRYLAGRRIVLLTGMMRDKQPEQVARILSPWIAEAVTTSVCWPRAIPAEELADLYQASGIKATPVSTPGDALRVAQEKAGSDGLLLVAGSLYLVGEVRRLLASDPTLPQLN